MQLDHLLSPVRLGSLELRNRVVSTAHQTHLVADRVPTDAFVAYHEARARGGVGLIVLEATAVHESGRLDPHTLAGYDDAIVDGYRRVAAAVQGHGCRLAVQLFHGGRELIASAPRPAVLAPSALPSERFKTEPRALRAGEIEEIVEGYARAAARAVTGGLDGVEISAAHNYLVAQFFTPSLNARSDRWRAGPAFLLAVVDAVRRAAPGLALGVRLSADSIAAQGIAHELADRVDYLSPRARRVVDLSRLERHRAAASHAPERDRRLHGVLPRRAADHRHVADRRSGRRRPADRRGQGRRRRDDPRADHGSRAAGEGCRGTTRPPPALYRVQRVHRSLPRRYGDRLLR